MDQRTLGGQKRCPFVHPMPRYQTALRRPNKATFTCCSIHVLQGALEGGQYLLFISRTCYNRIVIGGCEVQNPDNYRGIFFFPLKGSLTSKAEISGTVGCDFWRDLPTQCSGIKSIPSANQMSGNVCLKEPNLLRQEIHWESFPSRHDKLCLCFSWKGGCALNDSLWATSE